MPDRLLIVGGTGFIGTNLTRYAVDCGYLVTVLSLNIPPSDKKIEKVTYLQADVANLL